MLHQFSIIYLLKYLVCVDDICWLSLWTFLGTVGECEYVVSVVDSHNGDPALNRLSHYLGLV